MVLSHNVVISYDPMWSIQVALTSEQHTASDSMANVTQLGKVTGSGVANQSSGWEVWTIT
jgi:hypothetical protein